MQIKMKKLLIFYFLFMMNQLSMAQEDVSRLDWGNLKKYEAENQALMKLPVDKKRVVFMGNSITEFWRVFDSSFFSNKSYVNRGISGQTTPQMLIRFRADVIELKPSVVVILAGINDIAENTGPISIEHIFGNILSMTQIAKASGIKVILSSVLPAIDFWWRHGLHPAEKIVKLNKLIRTYCEQNKIVYVDYYSAMTDGQLGLRKDLSDDGVHPNLNGYRVMDPLVEAAIKKALSK